MPTHDQLLPLRLGLETLLLEQEMAIAKALRKSLYAWLPTARAAVGQDQQIVVLAASTPVPDAIAGTATMWTEQVDANVRPAVGAAYVVALQQAVEAAGLPLDVVPHEAMRDLYWTQVRNRIVGMPNAVWRQMTATMNAMIDEGTSMPAIAAALDKIMSAANLTAEVNGIARTEATGAYNGGTFSAWQYADDLLGEQSDKVWVATRDTRTRKTHRIADEQRVPLAEPFIVGGVPMMYPGWPGGPVGEVVMCRCAMVQLAKDEQLPNVKRKPWPVAASGATVIDIGRRRGVGPITTTPGESDLGHRGDPRPTLITGEVFHLPGEHDQKSHGRRGLPELDLDADGIPVGFDVGGLAGKAGWPDDRSKLAEVAQAAHRAGFDEARFDGSVGAGHMAVNPKEPRVLLMSEFDRWDDEWFARASTAPAPFGPDQTFWMPQSRGSTQAGYLIDHESGHSVAFENGQHAADYPRLKETVAAVAAEMGVRVYGTVEFDMVDGVLQYKRGGGEGRPLTAEDVGSSWPTMEVTRALADLGMSWKVSQGPAEMYAEMWAAWLGGSEARVVQAVAEAEGWTR